MEHIYIGTWKGQGRPAQLLFMDSGSIRWQQELSDSVSTLCRDGDLLFVLVDSDPEVEQGCGGAVLTYRLDADGKPCLVHKSTTYGFAPIDLIVLQDELCILNHGSTTNRVLRTKIIDGKVTVQWEYDESSLVLLSRNEDGTPGALLDLHKFYGSGEIPFFQESAAPHSLTYEENSGLILVPQRGAEKTAAFQIESQHLVLRQELPEGRGLGPRNAILSRDGRDVYVVDEICPNITHFRLPEGVECGRTQTVTEAAASKCDTDCRLFTAPHPVAIAFSETEEFVYVLTRSTDTVSVFHRDPETGALTMVQEETLAGSNPRMLKPVQGGFLVPCLDTENCVAMVMENGKICTQRILLGQIPGIAAVEFR